MKKYKSISPDFPRIPHISRTVSNMTEDDIVLDAVIKFPLTCWVSEKIDGANMGVICLDDHPMIRNRKHILNKNFSDIKTPAKKQFQSAWNWAHDHLVDLKTISKYLYDSPLTVYGEWMKVKHSIFYDELPDYFLAYDIYIADTKHWLSPDVFEEMIKRTNIKYIKSYKVTFNNMDEIIEYSERKSEYRNGVREGIVIKITDDKFNIIQTFKVVNKYFERREDFNVSEMVKNILK